MTKSRGSRGLLRGDLGEGGPLKMGTDYASSSDMALSSVDHRPDRGFSQKRTSLVVFLILLISVLTLTLWMVLPYLLAALMGSILALLSQPLFQWLRAHRFKTRIASLIVTLGVLILIIAPISFFVTKAIQQGIAIGEDLAGEGGFSIQAFIERIGRWSPIKTIIDSPEGLETQFRRWIRDAGVGITTTVLGVAAQFPKLVLQIALASLACFFFLIDGARFKHWVSNKIPLDPEVRIKLAESFKNTAASVIWATLAAASAQSAIVWVGYLVLGIPAAFLAAGATFIFAWIPIIGSAPVWVTGALYLYFQGMTWKAVLMVAFGLVAGVIDNFIRPMVLKGRSKMHPLVSLVAIFGGISMFGIMGIFVGPILTAILISLLQIWPAVGERFGLLPESIADVQRICDSEPKNSIEKAV